MEQEQGVYNSIFQMDTDGLAGMIERYPWFSSARIYRSALTGEQDEMLAMELQRKPWPAALLHDTPVLVSEGSSESPQHPSDSIIDRFLDSGAKKIVPDDSTPDDDVSEGSSVFIPDEDMDTDELARIYRQQGLDEMADEVSELVEDVLPEEI